ncbi:MAG: chemotaxis protein CheA [Candidatus Methylomirabilia bacterium]
MTEPLNRDEGMDEVLHSLLGGFRDEARELLGDMESALMELEARPDDGELVARAFRALHTIKGNGAMFGLAELERFAHALEHVFDLLRKGMMAVSSEVIDLTLGAKDRLLALLEAGDTAEERRLREADLARIARLLAETGAPTPTLTPPVPGEPAEPKKLPESLVAAFKEEAQDLLRDLEGALMELEARPDDEELVARAFRALHTIKGNAGMFGFIELEAFAHEIESVFEELQTRKMPVTRELVDMTLEARDRILNLLLGSGETGEDRDLRERETEPVHRVAENRGAARPAPASCSWRIFFKPQRGLFAGGTDPLLVLEELRAMGECSVTAQLDAVPALAQLDPGACYLSWEILLTTSRPLQEIQDAFIFVGSDSVVEITPLTPAVAAARNDAGAGVQHASAAVVPAAPREEAAAPHDCVAAAALRKSGETATTLRVGTAKLDKLVDLVGELVTVQARLSLVASLRPDPELLSVTEEVERLTAELRDHSLSVRMVPIGPAFGKFRRLVRDLSHEIGREVEMTTSGEDTELDKNVIDRLNDPIVHLLRNSIDHGIEPAEQRRRAGKPPRGSIRLSASYAGANVVIRVEDDGAGIDAEAVRQRAIQRGLIGESEQPAERELHALMFLPGFSTSEKVTKISGRGVGLDVVKRAVEGLRGRVFVQSRAGEGTVFEIRIPLTLAIIEGLEVVLGGDHLILPLAVVKECVELVRRPGDHGRERSLAEIRGELVPYVRLRDWFQVSGEAPAREQIVVTETEDRRIGLVVDQVVGGQQTVIKPLGRLFRGVRGLAGATILGDGTVALILDVVQLVQHVEQVELERTTPA